MHISCIPLSEGIMLQPPLALASLRRRLRYSRPIRGHFEGFSTFVYGMRIRVFLFIWFITFDLSGIGDPTTSYATVGIALRLDT